MKFESLLFYETKYNTYISIINDIIFVYNTNFSNFNGFCVIEWDIFGTQLCSIRLGPNSLFFEPSMI